MPVKPKADKRRGGVTGKGFLPGRSGNHGGRVREVADLRELARQPTPTIINNLIHIVEHGRWPHEKRKVSDPVRMGAHVILLDRGYGKPMQAHEIKNAMPLPIRNITPQMTPQEAAEAYHRTLNPDGETKLLTDSSGDERATIDADYVHVTPGNNGEDAS